MNRRTIGAAIVTALWLMAGIAWYLVHPESFSGLKANQMGDVVAGFFAPMAFLWIVVAYFQQGDELRQDSEALRLQEQELGSSRGGGASPERVHGAPVGTGARRPRK